MILHLLGISPIDNLLRDPPLERGCLILGDATTLLIGQPTLRIYSRAPTARGLTRSTAFLQKPTLHRRKTVQQNDPEIILSHC
jgi:hypothetical protein